MGDCVPGVHGACVQRRAAAAATTGAVIKRLQLTAYVFKRRSGPGRPDQHMISGPSLLVTNSLQQLLLGFSCLDSTPVFCRAVAHADKGSVCKELCGVQEDVARSESLVRKALEPIGRIVPVVYAAVSASIAKLAAGDAKHGPRLVLENLAALQPPVDALAAAAPDVRALAGDLRSSLERARDQVVEEQLQACKLWPLLSFAGRLHVLLREVAPAEVQFQVRAACYVLCAVLRAVMFSVLRLAVCGLRAPCVLCCALWRRHNCEGAPAIACMGPWPRCKEVQPHVRTRGLAVTPAP